MKKNITIILILLLTIVSSSIPAAASSKAKSDKKEAAKQEKIMEAMKILQTGQFRIKYYIEPSDRANYNMTRPSNIYYRYDTTDPEYVSTSRSLDTINGTYTVKLVRKSGDVTNVELNLHSGYLKLIFPGSFKPFHNNRGGNMLDYTSILPLYDIDYTKPRIQRRIVDSGAMLQSGSTPAAASSKVKSDKKEAAKHEKIMEAMKILQTGQFQIKQYNSKPDDMYGAAYYAKYDLHNSRDYEDITQSLDTTKQLFTISFRKVNADALSLELNLKTGYLRKIWPDRFGRSTTSYDYTCILPLADTDNPDYTKPRIQRRIVDSDDLLQSGSTPAAASSKVKSDRKEAAKHEKIMEAMKILQTGQFRIKCFFESSRRVYGVTRPQGEYAKYDRMDPWYSSFNQSMDSVNQIFTVRFTRNDGSITNIELNLNSGYVRMRWPAYDGPFGYNGDIYKYNYASIFPLYDTENPDYTKPRIQRRIVDSYNLLQSGSFMISMPLAGLALADGLGLVVDPREGRAELVSSACDTAANLYTARYITDKAAGTSAQLRYNYRDGSLEVDIYEGDEPIITQLGSYKHIVAAPK